MIGGGRVFFRVDASLEIGTGHVMRCLALADELVRLGHSCHFICREHIGHLGELIRKQGHHLTLLARDTAPMAEDAVAHYAWLGTDWRRDSEQSLCAMQGVPVQWLVVDHYALDWRWERALGRRCRRILAIDDLADRPHACDLLLDQTPGRSAEDYVGWVAAETQCLTGADYALLRPEFLRAREAGLRRQALSEAPEILVNMGGVDPADATGSVLRCLQDVCLPPGAHITVVMGAYAPSLEQVVRRAADSRVPCRVLVDVSDMAAVVARADLAIGAGGVAALERCCLGLPSVVVVLAENQRPGAFGLAARGAARVIGSQGEIETLLGPELLALFNGTRRSDMSESARAVVDGRGARRAVAAMEALR